MKRYDPTPEQRAAMDRAKNPRLHPYRRHMASPREERTHAPKAEHVVPKRTRLVAL
ncbi:hypothetical protein [Xanthomonas sacchari]|uniref:hypothetical protein n=1 Tax=Xanthomonas sacchari TaxID=56458 RepID=UPI00225ABE92|nr:hypothetical protein [Xanthomonas sacchari]MCW0447224.1 hypothetical protein [Xanthomonas sacchari]